MRRRMDRLAAVLLVGMLLAGTSAGCAGQRAGSGDLTAPVAAPTALPGDPLDGGPDGEPSAQPSAVEALGAAPTRAASPSAAPSRTPSRAPRPRPVAKPPTETKVPPAPPKSPSSGCEPSYQGSQASRAQAKAALTDAAAKTYWPTSAPSITIPLNLVKATAWQESGWQSNIVACDGGIGLMQVMPATADWMNQRFGQSYDVRDYRDNAYLGANYLAWLTKYIGDMYFEADYRLDAGLCTAELDSCLLNAVIAAYNYGHGAVAVEGRPLAVPNPGYVRNVRALMTECVCLGY